MSAQPESQTLRPSDLPGAAGWLDSPNAIACAFGLGLLVRVLLAPHFGFYGDLRLFQQWAQRLAVVGPRHFYAKGYFADYPPGYLYILYVVGKVSVLPSYLLLKLPSFLADMALAWFVVLLADRLGPPAVRRLPRAVVAAAFLLNPAVIALSAGWGQVDAVPAAFVLGSLVLLLSGRRSLQRDVAAIVAFAIGFAMKPQSAFIFPVIGLVLFRRYLYRRPLTQMFPGAACVALAGAAGAVTWVATGLPFGLGPAGLVRFYAHSSSQYPVTSAWAFNFWGLVGFWRPDTRAAGGVTVAGIPAVYLGWLTFLIGVAAILWMTNRAIDNGSPESRLLLVAAAATSVLAFAVLTRMHERYLFPSLTLLAPLVGWPFARRAYVALSALFLVNLWFPYAYYNLQWQVGALAGQPLFSWVFGGLTTFETTQRRLLSLVTVCLCLLIAARVKAWTSEPGVALATSEPPGGDTAAW